ncbi:chromosome condensation protein CrcB [Leucobacter viscericola]|uniref:Fluoride-specific ion channel FluC n=1 Tax=Leucobacter viscericola TaxID=2714935 RepID=A0A6G7XBI6_9MICO|nr:CrcB family protein [Leucobacter viscericola]QIK61826.1 chromosome condensation protein CrcB [Leucobacter viscericola]
MSGLGLALLIAVAGGIGAAARYAIDSALTAILKPRFPWGIMLVNLTGSFALGYLTGLALDSDIARIISVGLLGGYTTFSTASIDSVRLVLAKRYWAALLNGPGMLVASVALAVTGIVLARG